MTRISLTGPEWPCIFPTIAFHLSGNKLSNFSALCSGFGIRLTANAAPDPRRSSQLRVASKQDHAVGRGNPRPFLWLLLLLIFLITLLFVIAGDKGSPTVINEDGEEVLSPDRQAKLDRELDEIDNAEQYVLTAARNGYYPCYTCPDGSPRVYLYKGEVWKYGTTRKTESGRYPRQDYGADNLLYKVEFRGTVSDCLKLEKIKIYYYSILPEAKKVNMILFRPPGNANDN